MRAGTASVSRDSHAMSSPSLPSSCRPDRQHARHQPEFRQRGRVRSEAAGDERGGGVEEQGRDRSGRGEEEAGGGEGEIQGVYTILYYTTVHIRDKFFLPTVSTFWNTSVFAGGELEHQVTDGLKTRGKADQKALGKEYRLSPSKCRHSHSYCSFLLHDVKPRLFGMAKARMSRIPAASWRTAPAGAREPRSSTPPSRTPSRTTRSSGPWMS